MGFFDQLFRKRRDVYIGNENRDWRTLVPQEVSRVPEGNIGRKRAVRSQLPKVLAVFFFVGVAGLCWLAVSNSASSTPASGVLRLKTDGFLSQGFVQKVIANGALGFERDVRLIKKDLELDNQVLEAQVRRRGDQSLDITLRERLAVAKIATTPAAGVTIGVRLVASDGQTFAGMGYPEQAIRNLPEIKDYNSTGTDDRMTIEGIEIAAPFLSTVSTNYPNLYKQWSAVSLRDCFGAQADAPGSNLRVSVRQGTQPTDRPALVEIVFSTANWKNELSLLSRINVEELLRRPTATAPAYVLKLSIQNRTSSLPVPEPRLVPAPSR
jgi:hypothetical protein